MILSEECASFMHKIFSNVWGRLNNVGIDYTYHEMEKHFREMMNNGSIQLQVENIFVSRFIEEDAKNEDKT